MRTQGAMGAPPSVTDADEIHDCTTCRVVDDGLRIRSAKRAAGRFGYWQQCLQARAVMRAVGMYLVSYIMSIFEIEILDYLSEVKDFLQSEESLEAFLKGKNLSDGDRARLARWQRWSESPEQEAIVDCFRRATEGAG